MSKPKILIVEDETVVSADLAQVLNRLGYSVCGQVTTGYDAIRYAQREWPDLVLMDIRLSGEIDGVEAAQHISTNLNIPVVFLTAFDNPELVERAVAAEPYGYVVKPYQTGELRANIELALYKAQVEQERKRLTSERDTAMADAKTLRGLLPICSSCNKIRDEHGSWQRLERYIQEHSEAVFSHSLCPECQKRLYPDLDHDPNSNG